MMNEIDMTALERLERMGGATLREKMVSLFFETSRKHVNEASAAGRIEDWTTVRGCVHPLKSSAAYVGATRVRELSLTIEKLVAAGETSEVAGYLGQLEQALAAAHAALRDLAKGNGS